MNLCVYCKLVNDDTATVCTNCGYDLKPQASIVYKYSKLIEELKAEISNLQKQSYTAYSNWEG